MKIENILNILQEAVIAGGNSLLQSRNNKLYVTAKKDGTFCTQADILSEKSILNVLKTYVPNHCFVCEEHSDINNFDSEYTWIIDPLDGTINYYRNSNYFCVSIAVAYRGEIIAGAIYEPVANNLYVAAKGQGATLNNKRIKINQESNVNNSVILYSNFLILTNFLNFSESVLKTVDIFTKKFVPYVLTPVTNADNVSSIKGHYGASALELAQVASGEIDVLFVSPFYLWDVAAGYIIVKEAGGCIYESSVNKIQDNLRDNTKNTDTVLIASNINWNIIISNYYHE